MTLVKICSFALFCVMVSLLAPAHAETPIAAQAIQADQFVRAEAARQVSISRFSDDIVGLDFIRDKSKSQVVDGVWARKMTKTIAQVDQETGSEVQVVVVDVLVTSPQGTRTSPKEFATRLFDRWRIGPARVFVLHVLDDLLNILSGLCPRIYASYRTDSHHTESEAHTCTHSNSFIAPRRWRWGRRGDRWR